MKKVYVGISVVAVIAAVVVGAIGISQYNDPAKICLKSGCENHRMVDSAYCELHNPSNNDEDEENEVETTSVSSEESSSSSSGTSSSSSKSTSSSRKKSSSSSKKSSSSYDDGYNDIYEDDDYDFDRYYDDDDYASGVDDAMDDWDEGDW